MTSVNEISLDALCADLADATIPRPRSPPVLPPLDSISGPEADAPLQDFIAGIRALHTESRDLLESVIPNRLDAVRAHSAALDGLFE
jgi:hypothetical protein